MASSQYGNVQPPNGNSPPLPVSVGRYDTVRGSLPLPPGFKPRRATIHVLDKIGGKLMGMRVVNVS